MKKITNVFYYSIGLVLALVIFGIFAPGTFENLTSYLQQAISTNFGWYYLILVIFIVVFCIFLILSPIGAIKLGKPEDEPEYSKPTWFAMLFSAGMGIGLVFWGAAEPLSHYIDPALAQPETREAFKESMRYTFFHYGIHAWAIYGIIALALAYFNFRKGEPGLISATLKPLFGDRMNGKWGTFIDVFAVFATVFGVATTLGFGAAQINGGLKFLFGIPVNFTVQLFIVLAVTVLFLMSAWSGLGKGIKYLSNANMYLAIALFALVFIAGPTVLSLDIFTDTVGSYIQNFIQMSFRIAPLNESHREWVNSWTIFYWAWWISWSPFVGLFIARVSKGRTIREFLVGVLLLPSVVSFLWFSVFGTTAIKANEVAGGVIGKLPTEQVLFAVFEQLPWTWLISIVALILVGTFFITSADSATFVLGMLTTNGSMFPPNRIKIIWGILQSSVALVLLYSGGLQALQNALIAAALPFSIVMILMIISLYKSLAIEQKELGLYHEMNELDEEETNS